MYLVFAGDYYYPTGGAHDLIGVRPTLDEAMAVAHNFEWDWWHIYSVDGEEIVREGWKK